MSPLRYSAFVSKEFSVLFFFLTQRIETSKCKTIASDYKLGVDSLEENALVNSPTASQKKWKTATVKTTVGTRKVLIFCGLVRGLAALYKTYGGSVVQPTTSSLPTKTTKRYYERSCYPHQPDRLGYLVKAVVMPRAGHRIAKDVNMIICNADILYIVH